jgi:thiol-disulfide isomerase/thioredoxin
MIELTEDNLLDYISGNEKVVVQFGATWCGACKVMKPRVKKIAADTEGVLFIYADAEKFNKSRKITPITNLPTFVGFVKGEEIGKSIGSKTEALKELITNVVNA